MKTFIPMTDAELAAMWNQHEYCPECKGTHIKNVSKQAKVSILGFMWAHDVPEFLCEDCGCRWLTNEPSKHIKINAWTGKRTEEVKLGNYRFSYNVKKLFDSPLKGRI